MHPGESIGLLRVSWWLTDGELAVGCALGAPVRAVNDSAAPGYSWRSSPTCARARHRGKPSWLGGASTPSHFRAKLLNPVPPCCGTMRLRLLKESNMKKVVFLLILIQSLCLLPLLHWPKTLGCFGRRRNALGRGTVSFRLVLNGMSLRATRKRWLCYR